MEKIKNYESAIVIKFTAKDDAEAIGKMVALATVTLRNENADVADLFEVEEKENRLVFNK